MYNNKVACVIADMGSMGSMRLNECTTWSAGDEITNITLTATRPYNMTTDGYMMLSTIVDLNNDYVAMSNSFVTFFFNGEVPSLTKDEDTIIPHEYVSAFGATFTVLYVD